MTNLLLVFIAYQLYEVVELLKYFKERCEKRDSDKILNDGGE